MTEIAFTPETMRALTQISSGIEALHEAIPDVQVVSELSYSAGIAKIDFILDGIVNVTIDDDEGLDIVDAQLVDLSDYVGEIPVEDLRFG